MAKKTTTKKKPRVAFEDLPHWGWYCANGIDYEVRGLSDPKTPPSDWWVNEFYINGKVDGFIATRGNVRHSISGPFSESKAKSEADRLNDQLNPKPADVSVWDTSIPSWTVAVVISAVVTSGAWFIFTL